jgi:hypothetical protein
MVASKTNGRIVTSGVRDLGKHIFYTRRVAVRVNIDVSAGDVEKW